MSSPGPAVRLICGSVVAYAATVPNPARAEVVPCHRHGYCEVTEVLGRPAAPRRERIRRPVRTVPELLDFVAEQESVTVDRLMSQRFRLRLIQAASRQGLLAIADDGVVRLAAVRSSHAG